MTLASLKRSVVVGTQIHVLKHWQPKLTGTMRTANKVQGNGYWFEHDGKRMWAPWPTAKDIAFDESGAYTVNYGEPGTDNRLATFRLVSQ